MLPNYCKRVHYARWSGSPGGCSEKAHSHLTGQSETSKMAGMSDELRIAGVRGTTDDGLLPLEQAKLASRAIRGGWCPEQRKALIESFYGLAMDDQRPVRDRSACARVLATLERNEIMAERNAIQESGHELSAQTDRLRAALSDPVARAALASLASAGQQPAPMALQAAPETPIFTPVPSDARENMGEETTQAALPTEGTTRLEQGTDWASAGGTEDD